MSGVLSPSGAPQALHFVGPTAGPLDEQIAADVAVAGGFSVPQLLAITTLVLDCLKSPKVRK